MKTFLPRQFDTQMFSLAELDLASEYLPRTAVFEIPLVIAVTRIIRIMDFFVPNSGSPSSTQSGFVFSDLNFSSSIAC